MVFTNKIGYINAEFLVDKVSQIGHELSALWPIGNLGQNIRKTNCIWIPFMGQQLLQEKKRAPSGDDRE